MSWIAPPLSRRQIVFIAICLTGVGALTALTLLTSTSHFTTRAWSPATGLAAALGLRLPRRHAWWLAGLVAVITAAVAIPLSDISVSLLVVSALINGLEMWLITWFLRGRKDQTPALTSISEFAYFILWVCIAAALADVLAFVAELALRDTVHAANRIATGALKHAASVLVIAPLFLPTPTSKPRAGRLEVACQIAIAAAVTGGVFFVSHRYPVASLGFIPLVWAAVRLTTRMLLVELASLAVLASIGSALNRGPFPFTKLGPLPASVLLDAYELYASIFFLALSISVWQNRALTERLKTSELLYRENFETAITGMVLIRPEGERLTVVRANASAVKILGADLRGGVSLLGFLDSTSTDALVSLLQGTDWLTTRQARQLELTSAGGQILNASVSQLMDEDATLVYALQIFDVTDARRAREFERAELIRAGEIQRSVLTSPPTMPSGWQVAGRTIAARSVGGDFYDLGRAGDKLLVILGDVMGKGIAAGILAATARVAFVAQDAAVDSAELVTRVNEILAYGLEGAQAFVTAACATIDLRSGAVSLTDAGHGLTFVIRRDQQVIERVASMSCLPIGVGTQWTSERLCLEPGDSLVCVSDGVLDLCDGSLELLSSRMREGFSATPDELVNALICSDAADTEQEVDDITVVVISREPCHAMIDDADAVRTAASASSL